MGQWINKDLPETRYRARKRYSLDSPLEYDADSLNEKLPVVCKDCNNGWMSTLSLRAKDRFGRAMLDGEPFSLGARDAAILAAFNFMKAVVTNYVESKYEPFFNDFTERTEEENVAENLRSNSRSITVQIN